MPELYDEEEKKRADKLSESFKRNLGFGTKPMASKEYKTKREVGSVWESLALTNKDKDKKEY